MVKIKNTRLISRFFFYPTSFLITWCEIVPIYILYVYVPPLPYPFNFSFHTFLMQDWISPCVWCVKNIIHFCLHFNSISALTKVLPYFYLFFRFTYKIYQNRKSKIFHLFFLLNNKNKIFWHTNIFYKIVWERIKWI